MSTRKIIREVRAEIADMHEQSTQGMWGDYGEPMLVGEDLLRALSLLWRGCGRTWPPRRCRARRSWGFSTGLRPKPKRRSDREEHRPHGSFVDPYPVRGVRLRQHPWGPSCCCSGCGRSCGGRPGLC